MMDGIALASRPLLTFDADRHEYRADGRRVPNVTSILGPLYDLSAIPRDVLERKRQLGQAVHRAIEFDIEGDLDEGTLDPQVLAYVAAWRTYRRERDFEWRLSERRVFHPTYRFAGTLDLFGRAKNRTGKVRPVLIDLKTTFDVHAAVALQTAAYRAALASDPGFTEALTCERMALQLKPDGTYAEHWFEDPRDWPTFLNFLACANWRDAHL